MSDQELQRRHNQGTRESRSGWREPLLIYTLITLWTMGVGIAEQLIPWFSMISLFFVAAAFQWVPTEILRRQGQKLEDYGIETGSFKAATLRCIRLFFWILIPYAVLYIGTQQLMGLKSEFNLRSLQRWEESMRGSPSHFQIKEGEVWVGARGDLLTVRWSLQSKNKRIKIRLEGNASFHWVGRSSGIAKTRSHVAELQVQRSGTAVVRTDSDQLSLQVLVNGKPLSNAQFYSGAFMSTVDEQPWTFERNYWWIIATALIQLLLIGIPEELFYRGYLQTKLDRLVGRDVSIFGVACNPWSISICSGLFALAHIATIPQPYRLSVFFPSLLFGWIRRWSGDVITPALFHATCNLLSQVLWGFYQGNG